MYHQELRQVLGRLLPIAERHSAMRWTASVAGNCENPFERVLFARPSGRAEHEWKFVWGRNLKGERRLVKAWSEGQVKFITVAPGTPVPYELTIASRCRRCEKCRKARQAFWMMKAKQEIALAHRNWFGTVTLGPDAQRYYLAMARAHHDRQGIDYDALDFGDQFRERVRFISPEITKFLKRIRKNSGAVLRYLWVAEAHKSGNPHFHCLIHEVRDDEAVRHATLSEAWRLGFTNFKLVQQVSQGTYLCKYLSKSAAARVRASQAYGGGQPLRTPERHRAKNETVKPMTSKISHDLLETALW